MKSVMSFPDRGPWGKSNWRGNTSGYVIKEMIEHFKPKLFVDACEGSGTSGDVCREMGIEYVGLDLHKGNDFTKDYILSQLPRPADVCFSHPPYHDMIAYSGEVYHGIREGDTSRCLSPEEFISKSQTMLLNQREAVRDNGGIYATLIGDHRGGTLGKGNFRSYQADFIQMMPKDELLSVAIKLQHNCLSDDRVYSGSFVPIMHEYLIIWKKASKSLVAVSFDIANELQKRVATTWRNVIRVVMMKLGEAKLDDIYKEVEAVASHLLGVNPNWQAKVRQQLQKHHTNVARGVWAI
ncbi:hypothetical protein [Aquamicrobium sp.]|uniref:hypothetical protein n=1 Tax=Aquamicrobium sp. TaxID=1872579 RepID=UPI00258F850D|nr:hypothetical protein [Aquamicrobium sp.]MCK9552336.1 hypothetical protein [Aquamicrobium sp.]